MTESSLPLTLCEAVMETPGTALPPLVTFPPTAAERSSSGSVTRMEALELSSAAVGRLKS